MSRYVDISPYDKCRIVLNSEDCGFLASELSTADVEPIVHAHWIAEYRGDGWNDYYNMTCSACKTKFEKFFESKRCPECGAVMDGEAECAENHYVPPEADSADRMREQQRIINRFSGTHY